MYIRVKYNVKRQSIAVLFRINSEHSYVFLKFRRNRINLGVISKSKCKSRLRVRKNGKFIHSLRQFFCDDLKVNRGIKLCEIEALIANETKA